MLEKPVMHADTITLRPLTGADAPAMFAGFGDKEVDRLTGTQDTFTLEQVQAYYTRIETADDRADYAIVLKDDPSQLLGEVVLNEIDWENQVANFRIVILKSADFGKGYGSQATRLIVQYGFEQLKLHRIELEVYDFNPRAQRVYEKCGFKREGLRRETLVWEGERHGAIVMGMTRPDYDALAH
ncbi:MAG: GNAT family protein [Deinococcota bacterium]